MNDNDQLNKIYSIFRSECLWLQQVINLSDQFDPNNDHAKGYNLQELYNKSAPVFFQTAFRVFQEHIHLQIAKLIDPAESFGKPNLSIPYINKLLLQSDKMTDNIKALSDKIHLLAAPVKLSRSKIIAHSDMETVINNCSLGEISDTAWTELITSIYSYVQLVGETLNARPLDYQSIGHEPGDTTDMLNYLRAGVAFYGNNRSYAHENFLKWIEQKNLGGQLLTEWIKAGEP